MISNYFKTAIRNLQRNKVYSFINIFGLGIGLASTMLIMLYVKDEVSFDRFHDKADNIFRVESKRTNLTEGSESLNPYTGYFQGPRFAAAIPEIKYFVRYQSATVDMRLGTEVISQPVFYTDSSFFEVFSFPLLRGNPVEALKSPNSIVVSEQLAIRQFGTTDVVGRDMLIRKGDQFEPYSITGVTKKQPDNSSIRFEVLLPMRVRSETEANNMNWLNSFLNTFVELVPGADIIKVQAKMQQVFDLEAREALTAVKEKFGMQDKFVHFLQPFTAIHLGSDLAAGNGLTGSSNPIFSYILGGIAVFILIIACINFVNLTIARSTKRAREIGIRKVIGSSRQQLIRQFLGESCILAFMAFVLAIILVQLILPLFNDLSNKRLTLDYLADPLLVSAYIILFLVTATLAGFYPALVLSGYSPVSTLYNRFILSGKSYLQKSLVVLQFSLASFLIIATIIIYTQFNFLTGTDLGYDDDNLVIVPAGRMSLDETDVLRSELLKNKDIAGVTFKNNGSESTVAKINGSTEQEFVRETIDERYLPMLKVPIVQGRNFSTQYPSDSSHAVLINETFAKKAGWNNNAVGKEVDFWYSKQKYIVVGVVKDFHFEALHREIRPQLFRISSGSDYGKLLISIRPRTETTSLQYIAGVFKSMYPLNPYSYRFMEQENERRYEAEAKWKQIILLAAIITISISCIGLLGLSVLSAEKRSREIGIRKVLGASVQEVVRILSADFLVLVLLALIISIPLAWLAAYQWLQNYAYRMPLNWWIFASGGVLVIAIAFITVCFQAIRAAIANPVNSLKIESY